MLRGESILVTAGYIWNPKMKMNETYILNVTVMNHYKVTIAHVISILSRNSAFRTKIQETLFVL